MPPKAKKGEKKKGVKERKKDEETIKIARSLKQLLSVYDEKCKTDHSLPHAELKKCIKACSDNGRHCSKLILNEGPVAEKLKVRLVPLIAAVRSVRYLFIKEIYVWDIHIEYEDIAALGKFLEQSVYSVNYLEFMDCHIDSFAIERLSRSLNSCTLTTILLDYNKFGDEGCKSLCSGLQGNNTLMKLSLCYCDLKTASGTYLGKLISETAISELYLDGNSLECEGLIELIKLIVDKAEQEVIQKQDNKNTRDTLAVGSAELLHAKTSMSSTRQGSAFSSRGGALSRASKSTTSPSPEKKKKKSARKKAPPAPPKVGPWLEKLHVMNNGIDAFGIASKYAPVLCTRLVKKWITNSADLKELDIDDNLIGDLGGREILDGLHQRKQDGLNQMKIWVTHRMNSDTFAKIMALGSGGSKKAKKKKKKPGKKRI